MGYAKLLNLGPSHNPINIKLQNTLIALRRPEGAAKGPNVDTVKRFSDFARRYILMEFSVAQNFYAFRHFCDFRLKICTRDLKFNFKWGL